MDRSKFTPRIPKPADFKPESHFTEGKQKGRPRCPAWAKQGGAQCKHPAGHGTDKLHQVGACCKIHGGNSIGSPGRINAVKPDAPNSQYIRVDDLPLLKEFAAMSPRERADLLSNIMLMRAANTLASEKQVSDEKIEEVRPRIDARLIEIERSVNRSLRTVAAFEQIEANKLSGLDDDDEGANEVRTDTAMGLFGQLAKRDDGAENIKPGLDAALDPSTDDDA